MALVKCHECGAQVSTEAKACPGCGAKPQRPTIGFVLRNLSWSESFGLVVMLALSFWGIRACTTNGDGAVRSVVPNADAPVIHAPSPPAHHWVWHRGAQFGYSRELSDADRQNGVVTAPLFLVMFQGQRGSTYSFVSMLPQQSMTCTEPCAEMTLVGDLGMQVVPVTEGSILWALVEDARNEQFTLGQRVAGDQKHVFNDDTSVVATASPGAPVANRPTGAISTTDLYAEYQANPLAADKKYTGHSIEVTGRVVKTEFFSDGGIGNIRMMLADGGGSGTTDAIVLCFTESCASMKRPTVPDDQFKKVKVGDVVVATCTPEPVMSARPQDSRPMVNLSKCSMP